MIQESQVLETYVVDDIGYGHGLRCQSYIVGILTEESTLGNEKRAQVNSSVLVASCVIVLLKTSVMVAGRRRRLLGLRFYRWRDNIHLWRSQGRS